MKHVDLNVDLAEGCENDEMLLRLVSSTNIALWFTCGRL